MARLAEEIEDTFPTGIGRQASMDTVSHEMRHIILLYHQVCYFYFLSSHFSLICYKNKLIRLYSVS